MIEKIERGIKHPERIKRKAQIAFARQLVSPPDDAITFMDEDWDVLIVLDACRYDFLADVDTFDVPVKRVHSNASHTREYIENNFVGRDCRDTVYVTASPQFADFDLSFAHIEHVWDTHWDDEHRTVLPEHVTDAAINLAAEYPDKRMFVHYMQPHYPFIGSTGKKMDQQATFGPNREAEHSSVWLQLSTGRVSEESVRKAYAENLDIVLPEIDRLRDGLDGKIVLTSDHGNLFNERVSRLPVRISGHPYGVHHPELVSVPWVEFPFETRRTVSRSEESADSAEFEDVHERLSDLGYR